MARFFTSGYRFLEADYTAYLVSRKPGLPEDPFYTPAQFRETAAGIPKARLIIYPKMGHPASGKEFSRDVLEFLKEGWIEAAQTTSESRQI
jgi:hypothetical protein